MNDPRETKQWYLQVLHNPEDKTSVEEMMESGTLLKKNIKLCCFTGDNFEKMNRSGLVGRGFCHPRMWAQYADNHRGICLMFDKNILTLNIFESLSKFGRILHNKITYSDLHDHIDEIAFRLHKDSVNDRGMEKVINEMQHKFYHSYFFKKNSDWQDEDEYRFVLLDSNDGFRSFSIAKALRGIVLGLDFPDVYKECIKPFAIKNEIEVFNLDYYGQEYNTFKAW